MFLVHVFCSILSIAASDEGISCTEYLCLHSKADAVGIDNLTQSSTLNIIPKNYLKVIPVNDGLPLKVTYSIFVLDVNSVSPVNMDWRLDFLLTESWRDDRLQAGVVLDSLSYTDEYIRLPPSYKNLIWQPDPFIMNAKKFEVIQMKSKFESISLFSDKKVVYRGRFAAIMSCQMNFANFPNDIQVCPISIISYGFHSERIVFKWADKNPFELNENLKLLQYEMERPIEVVHEQIQFNGGTSSMLKATVIFRRQLKYYVIQTFIPSVLVVCLTWLTFWFGLDATPGRVMLCVTSLLTLTTMFQGLNTPPVSYIKAIDVWMIGCMIFVFATLVEFAIILYMDKRQEQLKSVSFNALIKNQAWRSRVKSVEPSQIRRVEAWTTEGSANPETKQSDKEVKEMTNPETTNWVFKIDYYSRYAFPISFIIFSVLFWYYLLGRSF